VLSLTNHPLYPRSKSHLSCWLGCSEGHRVRLETLEKGELSSAYRYSEHSISIVQYSTLIAIPNELFGVTNMGLFLDCNECLYYFHKLLVCSKTECKKCIPINWKSWILTTGFSETKSYIILACQGAAALKGRRNMMCLSKFVSNWGEVFRDLDNGWCRTLLRQTDSPNCETETANRTLQTESLTSPADGYRINFLKVAILL